MIATFSRVFFQGLITILPLALTLYVLWWFGSIAETVMRKLVLLVLSENYYVPGMGMAAGVVLIFLAGLMVNSWGLRQLIGWGEELLNRMPLIKLIYGPMRDLMQLFSSSPKKMGQVVMVRMGQSEIRLLGFVTRQDFDDLPKGFGDENQVAVYLPMSYQMGGFTVMMPKDSIEPIEFSMEEAMKFALTAGLKNSNGNRVLPNGH